MELLTPLYFSSVIAKVEQYRVENQEKEISRAFSLFMIERMYPTKSEKNEFILTDGPQDRGIDAIYIRERDGRSYVDIVQFKYKNTLKSAQKNFEETELSKVFSFIHDLFDRSSELVRNCNRMLKDRINDVYAIFDSGRSCSFKIVLCSNGLPLADSARERLVQFCSCKPDFEFEQIDFSGVFNLLIQDQRPSESIKLRVVDDQIFDRSDGDLRGVVACVEVNSFLDSIVDPATRSVKRYLFDDNIRVYLGDDSGYNKSIIASCLSDESYLFWYCNNGITVVCEKFEYPKHVRGAIISVKNFQIVNGVQTCYSLLKAREQDSVRVGKTLLLIKIFETKRRDISEKVAIATNSQARISLRDLHSNDELQKAIESYFLGTNIFYERKRNQHADKPQRVRIDALALGQMILSYRLRQPDKARKESDEIFGSRYHEIYANREIDRDFVLYLTRMYLFLSEKGSIALHDATVQDIKRYGDIVSYGFWYVIYTISLLLEVRGKRLAAEDEVDSLVSESIKIIDDEVASYKTVSNYDMFRSPRLRDKIERRLLGRDQFEFDL